MKTTKTASSLKLTTHGLLFADGTGIGRLRDGSVIIYHKGAFLKGSAVEYEGRSYEPAPLDPTLADQIIFPVWADDFGTADGLVSDLENAIRQYIGLEQNDALLLAFSILGTHLPECLPTVAIINIWGPLGADTRAIDVLSRLCRHALPVADASLREVMELPPGLDPTLIIRSQIERKLRPVLDLVSNGNPLLRKGRLLGFRCPIVVATAEPLHIPALRIPLLSALPHGRLLDTEAEQLRESFQGRLLSYRLLHHREVRDSRFDGPAFAPETRLLAAALGSTVQGFPGLQARLVEALESRDEQEKVELSQDRAAIVLEALLATCHKGEKIAFVGDIAKDTNAILYGRHEGEELSDKAVGILVRKLGLFTKRRGAGWSLPLNRCTNAQIHRLADRFGTLSLLEPFPECTLCQELWPARIPH